MVEGVGFLWNQKARKWVENWFDNIMENRTNINTTIYYQKTLIKRYNYINEIAWFGIC